MLIIARVMCVQMVHFSVSRRLLLTASATPLRGMLVQLLTTRRFKQSPLRFHGRTHVPPSVDTLTGQLDSVFDGSKNTGLILILILIKGKGKVFPYSLPSVGPGADPGVQAVSPQVT